MDQFATRRVYVSDGLREAICQRDDKRDAGWERLVQARGAKLG